MYHVPRADEAGLISNALGRALLSGALTWLLYLAVEPFVRRRWPQTIVSWSRALAGKLNDPLVGGDIMIGVAFGLFWTLLFQVMFLIDQRTGGLPNPAGLGTLSSVRDLATGFFSQVSTGIISAFSSFFLVFFLRVLLRKNWLAAAAFVAIFALMRGLGEDWWTIPFMVVVYAVFAVLLLRYGIVPLIVGVFTANSLLNAPITLNFSSWYIGSSLFVLAAIFAIAYYGFRCAVAGKALFEVE